MNAVISGHGLKSFTRALRHLVRVSTELYIEATKETLFLRSVNQGKTIYFEIGFSDVFFVSYQTAPDDDFEGNNCLIYIRQLLQALKNINNVINCKLTLDSKKEVFLVTLRKPPEYTFQTAIRLNEYECLEKFDPTSNVTSTIICTPSTINNVLNIPKNLVELALEISKDKIEIRNHIIHDTDVQTVRLKYPFKSSEFITYDIKQTPCLIISHEAFASVFEFAETSHDEVKLEFTINGEPLFISIKNNDFVKLQCVTSTIEENALKSLRRPLGAQNYKTLVGSYIEQRRSISDLDTTPELMNFDNTDMAKNLSPRISSFAGSLRGGKINLRGRKAIQATKRKSIDEIEKAAVNETSVHISKAETPKKQKVCDELSDVCASEFLANLAEVEAKNDQRDDLEVSRNEDRIINIDNIESDECRLDRSKAKFPTEDFIASSLRRSNNGVKEAEHKRKTTEVILKKAARLYSFEPILYQLPFEGGAVFVDSSDSD